MKAGRRLTGSSLGCRLLGDTLLKFQVAQFSRTLSTLLTGGTPLVTALQTASDALTSKLLRSTILRATQMVREGESLHSALASTPGNARRWRWT